MHLRFFLCTLFSITILAFSNVSQAEKATFECENSIGFFRSSDFDNIICRGEEAAIRLSLISSPLPSGGMRLLNTVAVKELLAGSGDLILSSTEIDKSLYQFKTYRNGQLSEFGSAKEKYYLFEKRDKSHVIRCEKHNDGYHCVTFINTQKTYSSHINTYHVFMALYHKEKFLKKFSFYYNFIEEFIDNTDFSNFITCTQPVYACTGKPHKVDEVGRPIDKDGNLIQF